VTLIALHTAIRFSGMFARFTAHRFGLDHLATAAERVAAELVTRAVETTGNPDPAPRYTDLYDLHIIGLRISRTGSALLIQVWDSDDSPLRGMDTHLAVVDGVSHEWSWYEPRGGGKVIWAQLRVPRPRQTPPPEPLPHRVAGSVSYPEPDQPVTPMRDPEFLRKVLGGLHRLDASGGSGHATPDPFVPP
jgi:hypothetical protein